MKKEIPFNKVFIANLQRQMDLKGFTAYSNFSVAAGLTKSYVQKILSGETENPSIKAVIAMCDTLKCPINALVPDKYAVDTGLLAKACQESFQYIKNNNLIGKTSAGPFSDLVVCIYEILAKEALKGEEKPIQADDFETYLNLINKKVTNG